MTTTQIQYFLSAAETLNFTVTAKRFFVSQQVVSRQIQALEKDMNMELFVRQKRKLALTSAGLQLYDLWHRHSLEMEDCLSEIRLRNQKERIVRVGILNIDYVITGILPQIELLNKRFPNIQWNYYLGNFAEVEHKMDLSEIDLAITLSKELSKKHPAEQSFILQKLQLYIFMSPDHPLAYREKLNIPDLSEENMLLLSDECSYDANHYVLVDCELSGFTPKKIEYLTDLNQLEFSLLLGKGVFVGYDIFFHNRGSHLKKFPIPNRDGMQLADLVIAWRYPNLEPMAQVFRHFPES